MSMEIEGDTKTTLPILQMVPDRIWTVKGILSRLAEIPNLVGHLKTMGSVEVLPQLVQITKKDWVEVSSIGMIKDQEVLTIAI